MRRMIGAALVVGVVACAGCAGSVEWGGDGPSPAEVGDALVGAAPDVGRSAGTIVGGSLGGAAGATVGGDLGEWVTKGLLGLLGIGGVADSARQRKKRGQAEADKREAEVRRRDAELTAREAAAEARLKAKL